MSFFGGTKFLWLLSNGIYPSQLTFNIFKLKIQREKKNIFR